MRFVIFFLFAAITLPCQAQQTVKQREEIRQKRIHKRFEYAVKMVSGKWEPLGQARSWTEWDSSGNQTITGRYTKDGTPYAMYLRTYDANNRCTKRVWNCEVNSNFPEGKPCIIFKDYQFDEWGNVIQEIGYSTDGKRVATIKFIRDSSGNPSERWDQFPDTTKNLHYVYRYNKNGDAISTATFDHRSKLKSKTSIAYTYDSEGHPIQSESFEKKMKISSKQTHKFDQNGNLIESIIWESSGRALQKQVFKYELF